MHVLGLSKATHCYGNWLLTDHSQITQNSLDIDQHFPSNFFVLLMAKHNEGLVMVDEFLLVGQNHF